MFLLYSSTSDYRHGLKSSTYDYKTLVVAVTDTALYTRLIPAE